MSDAARLLCFLDGRIGNGFSGRYRISDIRVTRDYPHSNANQFYQMACVSNPTSARWEMRKTGVHVIPVTVPNNPYETMDTAIGYNLHTAEFFIICSEGVGYEIPAREAMGYVLASGRCSVDLSRFIRTFGARLDGNHHLWYRRLGGE